MNAQYVEWKLSAQWTQKEMNEEKKKETERSVSRILKFMLIYL